MEALAGATFLVTIFGLMLAIAWIILPFAMFGIKPLLRELIAQTKRTNELIEQKSKTS